MCMVQQVCVSNISSSGSEGLGFFWQPSLQIAYLFSEDATSQTLHKPRSLVEKMEIASYLEALV